VRSSISVSTPPPGTHWHSTPPPTKTPPTAAAAEATKPAAADGKLDPTKSPAEAAAWAQIGCTLLNLESAIRRG
jgi:hypothetical protein